MARVGDKFKPAPDPARMRELGRKGGQTTKARHGVEHYQSAGLKGAAVTNAKRFGIVHHPDADMKRTLRAFSLLYRATLLIGEIARELGISQSAVVNEAVFRFAAARARAASRRAAVGKRDRHEGEAVGE